MAIKNLPQGKSAPPPQWSTQAVHPLVESQTMCESINALTKVILEGGGDNAFALLEAVSACVQRIEAAIMPVIDTALCSDVVAAGHGTAG